MKHMFVFFALILSMNAQAMEGEKQEISVEECEKRLNGIQLKGGNSEVLLQGITSKTVFKKMCDFKKVSSSQQILALFDIYEILLTANVKFYENKIVKNIFQEVNDNVLVDVILFTHQTEKTYLQEYKEQDRSIVCFLKDLKFLVCEEIVMKSQVEGAFDFADTMMDFLSVSPFECFQFKSCVFKISSAQNVEKIKNVFEKGLLLDEQYHNKLYVHAAWAAFRKEDGFELMSQCREKVKNCQEPDVQKILLNFDKRSEAKTKHEAEDLN